MALHLESITDFLRNEMTEIKRDVYGIPISEEQRVLRIYLDGNKEAVEYTLENSDTLDSTEVGFWDCDPFLDLEKDDRGLWNVELGHISYEGFEGRLEGASSRMATQFVLEQLFQMIDDRAYQGQDLLQIWSIGLSNSEQLDIVTYNDTPEKVESLKTLIKANVLCAFDSYPNKATQGYIKAKILELFSRENLVV